MATVLFKFEDSEIQEKTVDNVLVGDSILEVAENNGVHLNHNCGAVCACSTCHVYIEQGEDDLAEITDREEDFIDRALDPRVESRLGCQAVVLRDGACIEVTIPDQSRIIGHEH